MATSAPACANAIAAAAPIPFVPPVTRATEADATVLCACDWFIAFRTISSRDTIGEGTTRPLENDCKRRPKEGTSRLLSLRRSEITVARVGPCTSPSFASNAGEEKQGISMPHEHTCG